MNTQHTTKKVIIKDIYLRLTQLFSTEDIVIVGGVSLLLTCDKNRKLGDIDVTMNPKLLLNVSGRIAQFNGFIPEYDKDELMALVDKQTDIEIETKAKNCNTMNKVLGLPAPTKSKPTILGLPLKEVIENAMILDVNGVKIRIPSRVHQIIMKYNLWLFRACYLYPRGIFHRCPFL